MMTKGGKRSTTTNLTIKNAEPISKKTTRSKSLSSTVSNKLSPKIRKRRVGNVFSVPISTSPSSPLASPATRRSGASTIGHGANTVSIQNYLRVLSQLNLSTYMHADACDMTRHMLHVLCSFSYSMDTVASYRFQHPHGRSNLNPCDILFDILQLLNSPAPAVHRSRS